MPSRSQSKHNRRSRHCISEPLAICNSLCHPSVMEIIGSSKEKGTIYVAVLTLAVIGAVLVLSTWQILQRQWEASMEHLELTAASVLQAVDSSLRRGPLMGRIRTSPETREFFRDLERNADILFVGLLDENGTRLVSEGEDNTLFTLPEDALHVLKSSNRWQGAARHGQISIYVAARRIQGGSAPAISGSAPGIPRRHARHYKNLDALPPSPGPSLFLMVAVDMEKHFAAYEEFKKTAFFQTAYILAAAVFLWILAIRFISRRKLARKALLLERFQARLIDNLPDGLLIIDAAGQVLAANPAARDILSVPGKDLSLTGGNLNDIAPPLFPDIDQADDKGWQQTSLGAKQLEIRVLPFQSRNPSTAEGDVSKSPARMVIVRDRTLIRTLEQNLAEAEKLAAIGSLAAGVAHEIRNPLSALRGFAQYFARKLAGKQPEEEYAQAMVRESDRLNRVITDLLYLARPRDLAPVRIDLATVCDEIHTLLHLELREQNLLLDCFLGTASVTADPDALKQALLNLLLNSLQALSNPADNGITSEATDRSIALITQSGIEKGVPGVWIMITDTGPGMTGDELAQARKPFFTTKKKGTGLGLALVHSIMQSHGGDMIITSPYPPEGTHGCTVGLFFPDGPIDVESVGHSDSTSIA